MGFLGVTGYTAEQLDKEENDLSKLIQSNPNLWEEHLHEAIAQSAKATRIAVKETLEVDFENIDSNNFFIQMMIFKEAEDNIQRRMREGIPTKRQQEDANMKWILDRELESYQRTTNFIASKKERLKSPHTKGFDRMNSELLLAQGQAELELHRLLWAHFSILPEDDVNKLDETLKYYDLINMAVHIDEQDTKRNRELLDAQSPEFKAWRTFKKLADDRMMTLTDAEFERSLYLPGGVMDILVTISDAEFARWRVNVNENAVPPVQNPGGLLLKKRLLFPRR